MLSLNQLALSFQSCADLQATFQSNECCSATLDQTVAEPLYAPLKNTITNMPSVMSQLAWMDPNTQLSTNFLSNLPLMQPIGTHTAQICEATDAKYSTEAIIMDGKSGDTDYPFGDIKVLATVGEYDANTGFMLVGVPDGMGAYLKDDNTVRYIFQSESYGPIARESWPFLVNDGAASFTGSHVMYIDLNRTALAEFMDNDKSAAHMVMGAGSMIKYAYNLLGDKIGARSRDGSVSPAPHFSNTDPTGAAAWSTIMTPSEPTRADWLLQSLCSAHMEERHQWGEGMGVEDNLFITNEEWTRFHDSVNYTGIPAHAIDVATHSMYAVGVFTLGGFEKIVEVNCGIKGYVCFAPSGYNGAVLSSSSGRTNDAARKNAMGKRPDGTDYAFPQDIVPARLYIGKKGYDAKGNVANDFLSRNGLAYGQLYGFATDSTAPGFEWRDAWHKNTSRMTGDQVVGGFYPIDWRWDGTVKDFLHDGSWDFQHTPAANTHFWNAAGYDVAGKKTEHNSPDPTGNSAFMQSSTAGYFGVYSFPAVAAAIQSAVSSGSHFPTKVDATYTMLEGELASVKDRIMTGGKGIRSDGVPANINPDSMIGDGASFEDIDGMEWIASSNGTYLVLQEDSGNEYGERMFICKVDFTMRPTYYFVAMSGGTFSTRMAALVGVPPGVNGAAGNHEFSGVADLTGLIAKDDDGKFIATTTSGYAKRVAERSVHINKHVIALGLQAHNFNVGMIETFGGDRGGQVYTYRPNLPM